MKINNTIEEFLLLKFSELDSCVAFIESENWAKLVDRGLANSEPWRMDTFFTNFVLTEKGKALRDELKLNQPN